MTTGTGRKKRTGEKRRGISSDRKKKMNISLFTLNSLLSLLMNSFEAYGEKRLIMYCVVGLQ